MSTMQMTETGNPPAQIVSPDRFAQLATAAGWREKVIELLRQRPYGTEPFVIDGKWIVIRAD